MLEFDSNQVRFRKKSLIYFINGLRSEVELIAYANIMQQQISIKSRNSNAFVIDFLVIHGDFRGRRCRVLLFAFITVRPTNFWTRTELDMKIDAFFIRMGYGKAEEVGTV